MFLKLDFSKHNSSAEDSLGKYISVTGYRKNAIKYRMYG